MLVDVIEKDAAVLGFPAVLDKFHAIRYTESPYPENAIAPSPPSIVRQVTMISGRWEESGSQVRDLSAWWEFPRVLSDYGTGYRYNSQAGGVG